MLNQAQVTANIPAADLARARDFYAEKLGLTPTRESDAALTCTTDGGSTFVVYLTSYAGQAGHTIAQFHLGDLDVQVADLESKGVTFEHYDIPEITWDGAIATIPGMGRAAWFKDSEDNILCLDDVPLP